MISRLFSPTLSYRLFDPMPLPKRARVVAGKSLVPRNRVATTESIFARRIKRIPTHR